MLHRLPLAIAVAATFAGPPLAAPPLASRTDLVSV